jgi:hypothetical protein
VTARDLNLAQPAGERLRERIAGAPFDDERFFALLVEARDDRRGLTAVASSKPIKREPEPTHEEIILGDCQALVDSGRASWIT